jgi:uncharacterized protein YecE (DUF72 family)
VRIGVAGWTDATLTAPGVFYPPAAKSAQARLAFYSSHFPLVEVDSSYYALPTRKTAELWVERTPGDFRFNIKAYALMTGHPAELSRLPRALKAELPGNIAAAERCYPRDLPPEFIESVWATFMDAIQPLQRSGKLGAVLLQYPPWFLANRRSAGELAKARSRLGNIPAAVEFRDARWLAPAVAPRTFALLREHAFSYVCVDEPQGLPSSVPSTIAVTNESLAMIRMHGRRNEYWDRRGATVAQRFRYLYNARELKEWLPRVVELGEKATEVHLVFNNCYANYGTTNALEIGRLIGRIYRGNSG